MACKAAGGRVRGGVCIVSGRKRSSSGWVLFWLVVCFPVGVWMIWRD